MDNKIPVETSARHIHLTKEHFAVLFGADAEPTIKKELSEPGQYAYNEKVTIVGPKKEQAGVSILGPFRSATQVELSATDARSMGIKAPIRLSGDIKGSAPCKVIGPKGELDLEEGVIVAKRHIHINEEDSAYFGVKTNDSVSVKVTTPDRALTFDDVLVRVTPGFIRTMHIDTDESNAAGCSPDTIGEVIVSK